MVPTGYDSIGGISNELILAQSRQFSAQMTEFFFHKCGRRVGGVPRSSLKGKKTQHDEGTQKQAKPTKPKQAPNPKKPPWPEADSLSSKRVSSALE